MRSVTGNFRCQVPRSQDLSKVQINLHFYSRELFTSFVCPWPNQARWSWLSTCRLEDTGTRKHDEPRSGRENRILKRGDYEVRGSLPADEDSPHDLSSRCYEVFEDAGKLSPYEDISRVPDGTGRVTENGVVYSMTCFDWLIGGKREALRSKLARKPQ